MSRAFTTLFVVLLSLISYSVTSAQATPEQDLKTGKCILPTLKIDERPGSTEHPTQVSVGFRLIDITAVEDLSQSIKTDFVISLSWTDPRLAAFEGCQFNLNQVWTPQIDIINSGRLFKRLREQVEVLAAGRVRYIQRYQGSLVYQYDGRRFPFDHQDIIISLLSLEYGDQEVSLVIDGKFTGKKPGAFIVADWEITQVKAEVFPQPIAVFRQNHSIFNFSISAKRLPGHFLLKVILPLTLIVFMSWTVFWIDPKNLNAQIGMSGTSMLTLIAFQFGMANILPNLNYYTLMDKFVVGSTIIVFLSLIESVTKSYLTANHKQKMAVRIDRVCRWIFPIGFTAYSLIIFYG